MDPPLSLERSAYIDSAACSYRFSSLLEACATLPSCLRINEKCEIPSDGALAKTCTSRHWKLARGCSRGLSLKEDLKTDLRLSRLGADLPFISKNIGLAITLKASKLNVETADQSERASSDERAPPLADLPTCQDFCRAEKKVRGRDLARKVVLNKTGVPHRPLSLFLLVSFPQSFPRYRQHAHSASVVSACFWAQCNCDRPTHLIELTVDAATNRDYLFAIGTIFSALDAFNIGANDVANSFATSVSSRSLTMRQACLAAALCEFLGAVLVGARVADTIKNGIIVSLGIWEALVIQCLPS